ncbi:MAG: DinB family protein [Chitinophagales bacterium]|nr:DinB family protein [Chitinophagales bacterium]
MVNAIRLIAASLIIVLFSQCSQSAPEQNAEEVTPSYSIAEQHLKIWDEATEQVYELIDHMPEDKLQYKPHDSLRTFAEQIVHIALSSYSIANMFLNDEKMHGPNEMNASKMTKDDLKMLVKEKLGAARKIMEGMSDERLLNEKVTTFMGNEMTRLEGMMFVHDHLTNHKAKANMYIRMTNTQPPKYRYY